MARYLSFGPAARAQVVFGDVGHVLLVSQRREPARPRTHPVSRTGSTAVHQQPRAGACRRQQTEARSRRHLVHVHRTARRLRGASATALSTCWHFSARQYFPRRYHEPKLAVHALPGTGGCKSLTRLRCATDQTHCFHPDVKAFNNDLDNITRSNNLGLNCPFIVEGMLEL